MAWWLRPVLASIALAGCGDDRTSETTAPSGDPPGTTSTVAASDRDASLEAIDRWLQAGRPDLAESIARVLVEQLPEVRHSQAALGRVLLARSGGLRDLAGPAAGAAVAAEAARVLSIAVSLAPSSDAAALQARRSLGLALEAADRLPAAIETYRAGGKDPTCRLYLGLALLRSEAVEEASGILEGLAADRPDDPLVRAALAEARFRGGRLPEAIAAADEAVRLDPESWPIRVRRAAILRRSGDPRAALETLLALDEAARGERAVVEETAAAWMAIDRPERAAETWATRARSTSEDLAAALSAATAFETAGRSEEAEAWMDIATLSAPDDPRIDTARAAIESIRTERRSDHAVDDE